MHDGVYFEKAGIPTAVCTTTEFANAARAQADALGLTAFNVILVEHPVQPLTRDEVRDRAETVFERVVEKLTVG